MPDAQKKLVAAMRGIAPETPESLLDNLAAGFLTVNSLYHNRAAASEKSGDQVMAELESLREKNQKVLDAIDELSPQALHAIPKFVKMLSDENGERYVPRHCPKALEFALELALEAIVPTTARPGVKPGSHADGVASHARRVFELLTADMQGPKPSFPGFLKQIYEALGIVASAEHYARKHPVKAPSQKP